MKGIKISNILDFLICILLPIQLCAYIVNLPIKQNYVYILYIIIIIVHIINNKGIVITKKYISLYIGIIFGIIIIPFLSDHVSQISSGLYIVLLFIFLYVCDIIGQRLNQNYKKIILTWAILSTFIIDYFLLTNISEFNLFSFKNLIGNSAIRIRSWFGFIHPNTTAMVLDTILILYYIILKRGMIKNNRFIKFFLVFLIIFNFIALICTDSRTAIFCFIIFLLFDFSLTLIKMIKDQRLRWLVLFIVFIGSILAFTSLNYTDLANQSSGRYETIVSNFKNLKDNNNLLLGVTVTNISEANNNLYMYNLTGSDNWYYMYIVRFGILGLILFVLPLIVISINLYKNIIKNKIDSISLSLIMFILVYGIGENVIYNQGVILSLLVWALIGKALIESSTKEQKEA